MVSIEPPSPGDVVQKAPAPGDVGALARALADDLGETDPEVRQLLKRLVKRVGWSLCEQTRDDTREIEMSGGLWSVSEKRRRSKGGTFFALLKSRSATARSLVFAFQDKKEAAPADPPFTWEQRGGLVRETLLHRGQAMTAKLTLIGRPEKVVQRHDFVVTALEYRGAPSLPKGLPLPKSTRTTYTVYIAAKQWRKVAALVQRPDDQLIVEGFCLPDPESNGIAVFAQSVTTKLLQRGKFNAPGGLAEAEEPAAARGATASNAEPSAPAVRAPAAPDAKAPASPPAAAQPPTEEEQICALLRQHVAGGRSLDALAGSAGLPLQRLRDIHEGRPTSLTPAQVRTLLQKLRQVVGRR